MPLSKRFMLKVNNYGFFPLSLFSNKSKIPKNKEQRVMKQKTEANHPKLQRIILYFPDKSHSLLSCMINIQSYTIPIPHKTVHKPSERCQRIVKN